MDSNLLTEQEYFRTQVFVQHFNRVDDLTRLVVLRVVYEGEAQLFTETIAANKSKDKIWYVQKAFRKARKSIRKWIKEQDTSLVGSQISFQLDEFNAVVEETDNDE